VKLGPAFDAENQKKKSAQKETKPKTDRPQTFGHEEEEEEKEKRRKKKKKEEKPLHFISFRRSVDRIPTNGKRSDVGHSNFHDENLMKKKRNFFFLLPSFHQSVLPFSLAAPT